MSTYRSRRRSLPSSRRRLPALLALLMLLGTMPGAAPVYAAPVAPTLLYDLDPLRDTTVSSAPSYFVSAGATTFFTATDDINGRELWKTDGTEGGTQLVVDAVPGAYEDPYPPLQMCRPAAVGMVIFYCPSGDNEVWRSDGTAGGTRLLLRNNPTSAKDFANLTRVGNRLFFTSSSGAGSQGGAPVLWSSDGTPAGTVAIKAFPSLQHFVRLVAVGDTLYFAIGGQIWKSDGTSEGTRALIDAVPTHMMAFRGELFYSIAYKDYDTNGLYRSDGTVAGTRRISPAYPMNTVLVAGNIMFFEGYGLWRSDGTSEGTFKLSGVGIEPSNMAVRGSSLYFAYYDYDVGYEALWASDGSVSGTRRLSELNSLLAGRRFSQILVAGDLLYFVTGDPNDASDATRYLWRSDLTRDGTYIVWNDVPSFREAYHVAGDALFFSCSTEAAGAELCRSDGTPGGTGLVKDIRVAAGSTTLPRRVAASGNRLFWVPDTQDAELWSSDGTVAGTGLVKQLVPGDAGSDPQGLTDVEGTLYFTADTPAYGRELWRSDGTADGTLMVKDLAPGTAGANLVTLHDVDGELLFFTSDGAAPPSVTLWRSDGTAGGTIRLKQFLGAPSPVPVYAVAGNVLLYFIVNDGVHGFELWTSNGTADGTALLADLAPGSASFSVPTMSAFGNTLYFVQYIAECRCVPRLWKSNGTAESTQLVKDMRSELPNPDISQLRATAGRAYFTLVNETTQSGLWSSDGSAAGTQQIRPNADTLPVGNGQRVLFPALDAQHGYELWSSDGTAQGTWLVRDIDAGPDGSLFPEPFRGWSVTQYQTALEFSASDRQHGFEPWISDGTTAGTRLLTDLEPGPGSARPTAWAVAGATLFLVAHTTAVGMGIWSLDLNRALSNTAPSAADATYSVDNKAALSGTLVGSDADGDPLSFSIVRQASKGTATVLNSAQGTFRYVPQAGASGVDSFQYSVSDGTLEAIGTISITIRNTDASNRKQFLPGMLR